MEAIIAIIIMAVEFRTKNESIVIHTLCTNSDTHVQLSVQQNYGGVRICYRVVELGGFFFQLKTRSKQMLCRF